MTLFADVQFSTEAIAVIGVLLGALVGAVTLLFKKYEAGRDRELANAAANAQRELSDMKSQRDSFKEIGYEAVGNLARVNAGGLLVGKDRLPPLAPVVPEHNSPTTEAQRDAAELQTLRARLVAETLRLDLPARRAAPMEGTPEAEAEWEVSQRPVVRPVSVVVAVGQAVLVASDAAEAAKKTLADEEKAAEDKAAAIEAVGVAAVLAATVVASAVAAAKTEPKPEKP